MAENISEIRKKPGESNAGKYEHVKSSNFAGPQNTFPINTLARARNALARAHYAKNPAAIERKVHEKYPALAKRSQERKETDNVPIMTGRPHQELGHMGISNGQREENRKKGDMRYKPYK